MQYNKKNDYLKRTRPAHFQTESDGTLRTSQMSQPTTLLEPEPPPSPLPGVLWGQDSTSLSSLLTLATTSLGSHRHPSLPRRLFRLTSRLTLHDVRLVFEQQRKTAPLSSGPGGFSQVSSPVFFLRPICSPWRPFLGSPSGWHPRLTHPLSSGIPTNQHSSTSSPILLLRPGLCRRLVTARTPLTYTRAFPGPPPSPHRALGSRQPLAHPRLSSGIAGRFRVRLPFQSLPVTSGTSPLSLQGLRGDNPSPYPRPFTLSPGARRSWEHRAFGLSRTPPQPFLLRT